MSKTNLKLPKDFILVPLEGAPDESLPDLKEKIGEVLINRNHLVSVQFNVLHATLLVTTTTMIGHGATRYRWEQEMKVQKTKDGQYRTIPDVGKFSEKSYDNWEMEPASILISDKDAITRIWEEVYPDVPFTGFDEHEKLINKISELKSAKKKELEEKAAKEKLGLTKVDGTPLTEDTVDTPLILGPDGEVANDQ
mgnify:CR=1 FL=1